MDLKGLISDLKAKWGALAPQGKKKIILVAAVGLIVMLGMMGYQIRESNMKSAPPAPKAEKKKEIALDNNILEKSKFAESQKEMDALKGSLDEIKKQMTAEKDAKAKAEEEKKKAKETAALPSGKGAKGMPPMPELPKGVSVPPPPGFPGSANGKSGQPVVAKTELIGSIELNGTPPASVKKDDSKKKRKNKVIYLPPSYMEANLLSGLDAHAGEGAKGHPMPVLLRIKDLAVLPNKVKLDLKGCFAIADGYGSLADERAHLRLVSVTCLSRKGLAVIDQKVKGFVVDGDGKIGLRGNVVNKQGAILARGLVAGFLHGFGKAVEKSYGPETTIVSGVGVTQTGRASLTDMLYSGAGGGVSQAAEDLRKFYTELGKQTVPVIQVGATRTVSLVIQEGVELEIKEYCDGGYKCEN